MCVLGIVKAIEEEEEGFLCESGENRPANAPLIELNGTEIQLSLEASAVRCNSKGRGSVYNPVFGICCHFCRCSLTFITFMSKCI